MQVGGSRQVSKVNPEDQLLLTLYKMRRNPMHFELAEHFDVSEVCVGTSLRHASVLCTIFLMLLMRKVEFRLMPEISRQHRMLSIVQWKTTGC